MSTRGVFDPRWAARLARCVFSPRVLGAGPWVGRHPSLRHGRAGEFLNRRPYAPGDDRRRIDWKAYARTDRWTVREDRDDANLRVLLMLDVSPSMGFHADGRPTKGRFAAGLLAGLGFVLHRQQDAVGLATLDGALRSYLPPRSGEDGLERLLTHLGDPPPGTPGETGQGLQEVVARASGAGAVILASDLLGPMDSIRRGLQRLKAAWDDVSVLQVLDPVELTLAFQNPRRFDDLETGLRFRADPAAVARAYRAKMEERQQILGRTLSALGIFYHLCLTDKPEDQEVARFLERRGGAR